MHSRCSPAVVLEAAKDLTDDAKSQVKKHGFEHLLEFKVSGLQDTELIMWLMDKSVLDPHDEYSFLIHIKPGKVVRFTPESIYRIIKAPFGGTLNDEVTGDSNAELRKLCDEMENAGFQVKFETTVNKGGELKRKAVRKVTRKNLERYCKYVKETLEDPEKEAQCFFYLLFSRFLLPSTDNNITGYSILCSDLAKTDSIDWCKVIFKNVKEGVIKRKQREVKENKSDSVSWVANFS